MLFFNLKWKYNQVEQRHCATLMSNVQVLLILIYVYWKLFYISLSFDICSYLRTIFAFAFFCYHIIYQESWQSATTLSKHMLSIKISLGSFTVIHLTIWTTSYLIDRIVPQQSRIPLSRLGQGGSVPIYKLYTNKLW